jgi:xylulokinase
MRVYLGLDLGTSAIKAVAIDEVGAPVASSTAAYPTHSPQPGWAEQDMADWLMAARAALHDLVALLPAGAVPRSMAVTGQLPTLVLLDDAGKAIRPAIVWYDGRAETEAATCLGAAEVSAWYKRSGIVLDAHYLAPMYAWVRRHEPGALAGAHRVCSAKDALLHALTGVWATDPSTASGYGVYAPRAGAWDARLSEIAGLPLHRLPPIVQPSSIAGALLCEWSDTGLPPGLPVICGAGDALTGVLGSGAAAPGTLAMINGTSTSLVVSSEEPVLDPSHRWLLTPHAVPALWGLEMDLMATGSALRWLASLIGPDPSIALPDTNLFARAACSNPGANGLVAMPYLAGGEQGALWDPRAPAAFVGLRLAHTGDDLARAMLEGILFETRRCLEVWEQAGVPIREVVISGGFDSRYFAPIAADALNRPLRVADAHAHAGSALGAALLAGLGAGAWDTATALSLGRRTGEQRLTPPAAGATRYDALYARYLRASAAARSAVN